MCHAKSWSEGTGRALSLRDSDQPFLRLRYLLLFSTWAVVTPKQVRYPPLPPQHSLDAYGRTTQTPSLGPGLELELELESRSQSEGCDTLVACFCFFFFLLLLLLVPDNGKVLL